jgi:4-hydroxybenzoate polyprenyltransferase
MLRILVLVAVSISAADGFSARLAPRASREKYYERRSSNAVNKNAPTTVFILGSLPVQLDGDEINDDAVVEIRNSNSKNQSDSIFNDDLTFLIPTSTHKNENSFKRSNNIAGLFQMTRPQSIPGIVAFYMLGTRLALASNNNFNNQLYWTTLVKPPMLLTLLAILLTSSTSMVVNDYYDHKLGRDTNKHDSAINTAQSLLIRNHAGLVRTFLSALYAAALLTCAMLPGAATRLSVTVALILTYGYTQYLKPITWIKNLVCAALIASSPLTSASAAMSVSGGATMNLARNGVGIPLARLLCVLFFGVFGREIMMDCNDVVGDARVGVRTVPVVRGRAYASRVALMSAVVCCALAMVGPVIEVGGVVVRQFRWSDPPTLWTALLTMAPGALRRLILASVGSVLVLRRSIQVANTQGKNKNVIDRAVDEGLFTILVFLASFV